MDSGLYCINGDPDDCKILLPLERSAVVKAIDEICEHKFTIIPEDEHANLDFGEYAGSRTLIGDEGVTKGITVDVRMVECYGEHIRNTDVQPGKCKTGFMRSLDQCDTNAGKYNMGDGQRSM